MNQKTKMRYTSQKGITLIALVITIIVLLILAGVTISMVLGEDGIISQAQEAKQAQERETTKERIEIYRAEQEMAVYGENSARSYEDFINDLHTEKLITDEEKEELLAGGEVTKGEITISRETVVISTEEEEEAKNVEDTLKVGDFVNYTDGKGTTQKALVLYDANSEYGLQLLFLNNINLNVNKTLEGVNSIYDDSRELIASYMNSNLSNKSRNMGSSPDFTIPELKSIGSPFTFYYRCLEDVNVSYLDQNAVLDMDATVNSHINNLIYVDLDTPNAGGTGSSELEYDKFCFQAEFTDELDTYPAAWEDHGVVLSCGNTWDFEIDDSSYSIQGGTDAGITFSLVAIVDLKSSLEIDTGDGSFDTPYTLK